MGKEVSPFAVPAKEEAKGSDPDFFSSQTILQKNTGVPLPEKVPGFSSDATVRMQDFTPVQETFSHDSSSEPAQEESPAFEPEYSEEQQEEYAEMAPAEAPNKIVFFLFLVTLLYFLGSAGFAIYYFTNLTKM
jgi:hypothetical protein